MPSRTAAQILKKPKGSPRKDDSSVPADDGKPKQVIVPAGAPAPKVVTSAANSVFAQGNSATKPKRQAAPPLDPSQVEIIDNAPIPPSKNTRAGSPYQTLLDKMKKGSCVRLPERNALSLATHMRCLKVKVTVRNLGDGIFGVWRLS